MSGTSPPPPDQCPVTGVFYHRNWEEHCIGAPCFKLFIAGRWHNGPKEQSSPSPPHGSLSCSGRDSAVLLLDALQHRRDGRWQPAMRCAVLSWVSCRGARTMPHSQFLPQWLSARSGWSRAECKGVCVYTGGKGSRRRGLWLFNLKTKLFSLTV